MAQEPPDQMRDGTCAPGRRYPGERDCIYRKELAAQNLTRCCFSRE